MITYYLTNDENSPPGAKNLSISDKFTNCGENTGNLIFRDSIRNQIQDVVLLKTDQIHTAEKGSKFVLALANAIRPGTGFLSDWVSFFEQAKAESVTLIGVGAQSSEYKTQISVDPGTKYFLDYVSQNSASIGARGIHTADVLNKLGIKNVDVIGCPSLYDTSSLLAIQDTSLPSNPKIAISTTFDSAFIEKNRQLLAFGQLNWTDYVIQNEIWIATMNEKKLKAESDQVFEQFIYDYSCSNENIEALRHWLHSCSKIFFDVNEWREYLKGIDFFVGARFHGAALAIKSGVRALPLVFDTRTRELCEHFRIPHISLKEFNLSLKIKELWALADYRRFKFEVQR